jgi:MinD-like ATPase involved in chromosome partitioning or flagellar assembly
MAERITILAGHYGSGKTNVAVNLALSMKKEGNSVAICDSNKLVVGTPSCIR